MQAELVVVKGNDRGAFVRLQGVTTVGRSSRADLTLDDTKASSIHARLSPLPENGLVLLEDQGSTNGTFVNDERIESVPLRNGDLVKIGRTLLVFRDQPAQVRLEDIELIGGGSSDMIRRQKSSPDVAAGSSNALRRASKPADPSLLEAMLLAAGELEPRRGVKGILDKALLAAAADRVLLFLQHPTSGGLGLAAAAVSPSAVRDAPVDPQLLRQASGGEVASLGAALAIPVVALGRLLGVLYADGSEESARDLAALVSGAQLIGLVTALDRSQQLVLATSEVVALAQESVSQRALELSAVLGRRAEARASDRLGAGERELPLETALLPGLRIQADETLLARGLDRLIQYARAEAVGSLRLVGDQRGDTVRLLLRYAVRGQAPDPEQLLDAGGPVADLHRSRERFAPGLLTVARVAILRAGGRFTVEVQGGELVFLIELRAAAGSSSVKE